MEFLLFTSLHRVLSQKKITRTSKLNLTSQRYNNEYDVSAKYVPYILFYEQQLSVFV